MISVKKDFNKTPTALLSGKKDAWKDKSVLSELTALYNGKCAYCETKTTDLQIDHYRPKDKYPWLANEWSNLLPVCEDCNNAKRNKFPIDNRKVEPENKNAEILIKEEPIIINPEIDTAENHFYFNKGGLIYGHTNRGRKTVDILDLNRASLIKERKKLYDFFFEGLKNNIIKEKRDKNYYKNLKEATFEQKEFSLFGHQICYQFAKLTLDEVIEYISINRYMIFDEEHDYMFKKGISEDNIEISEISDIYEQEIVLELDEYYKNIFEYEPKKKLELPFSITDLSITKFQGIKQLDIKNILADTQWIFLTGENGFGKTSILRAILLGLIGNKEFRQEEIDKNTKIELKLFNTLMSEYFVNESKMYYNIFGTHFQKQFNSVVVAYGANRTNLKKDDSKSTISGNLFEKPESDLYNFERRYKDLKLFPKINKEQINSFENFFKKIIPNLSKIDINSETSEVIYFENAENGDELPPVTFNKLAMGMRSVLAMSGDIVQKLSEGYLAVKPFKEYKEFSGIVIIDEFDNHLHPKWQKMLVEKFTKIFPKVQFIVSTHSPIPLLGAPKNSVVLKVDRTKKDGITAEKLDIDISTLSPNSILTSPIFGFRDIISEANKDLSKLRTEDDYDEILFNKEIEKRLNKFVNENKSE